MLAGRFEKQNFRTYLFYKIMSLSALVLPAVNGKTIIVKLELKAEVVRLETTSLEATFSELLGQIVQNLDISSNARDVVFGHQIDIRSTAVDDDLSICVREFGARPKKKSTSRRGEIKKKTYLIIVFPNHFLRIFASLVIVNVTVNASRSSPGSKLHNCSLSAGGSIGTARWMR